jgi:hypothetical protein
MTIELKDKEDRIACMRNEHAKEIEGLIRDLRGQSVQREKALKEEMEAVEVSCHDNSGVTSGRRKSQPVTGDARTTQPPSVDIRRASGEYHGIGTCEGCAALESKRE